MSETAGHVAVVGSDMYAPHVAAALDSIFTHHPGGELTAHFVPGPDFSDANLARLRSVANNYAQELHVHRMPTELTAGLPVVGDIGAVGWYRMFLGALLPDLDRILYLDTDAVVASSLVSVFATDLGDNIAAGVENAWLPRRRSDFERLDIDPAQGFVNSGFLLLDLTALREGATEAMVAAVRRLGDAVTAAEQDAINLAFGDRVLRLHPRWNCQAALFLPAEYSEGVFSPEEIRDAKADPAFVHFEGPGKCKPWHYLCDHPLRHLYFEHLARTPWRKPRLEGRTLVNVAKRRAPRAVAAVQQVKNVRR